jgi:hypothetical protein
MDLVIPTLGRAKPQLQATLIQLENAGYEVSLVVQPHETDSYNEMLARAESRATLYELPSYIKGIAATRDWIIHDMPGSDHVLMLDDDLHFAVRRDDDRAKFRQPDIHDIRAMVNALDASLEKYPHVSIGSREGGNRVTDSVTYNTRMMRVLGYSRSYMKKHKICFTPMMVMEDFHVTLQLLRRGQDCAVLNNWVSNQAGGSDAKGGCSSFRTLELQAENAQRLARLHPGFVKVVQKSTKTAWGGATRTDVVVQWKQARKAGENS